MQHRAHNIICVEDGYQWVLNGGADPREPMLKRDKWMNSSLIDMRFTFNTLLDQYPDLYTKDNSVLAFCYKIKDKGLIPCWVEKRYYNEIMTAINGFFQ